MHDRRLKALRESGKTLSRKARSRPESLTASTSNSTTHSPHASPAHSRAASRNVSDAESDDESDYDVHEAMSGSASSEKSEDIVAEAATERLTERIAELKERRRRNAKLREETLTGYLHLTRHYYTVRPVQSASAPIVDALMKSVEGGAADERQLALKALPVTMLTSPLESDNNRTFERLEETCLEGTLTILRERTVCHTKQRPRTRTLLSKR